MMWKWVNDWDRGTILRSVWGDEHENHSKDFELPDDITPIEIREIEKMGPGIKSWIYIEYLKWKRK